MGILQCKMCSGNLEYVKGQDVFECPFCGTKQTVPTEVIMDKENVIKMLDRANIFRKQCEFDQALEIFEGILAECPNEPEIFWSMVLCRYGVEYVKDSQNGTMIPTCHRTQFTSILNDPDFLSAIKYSNMIRKNAYMQEANYIDTVQKEILEIANKEKPFDVFICYKESDEDGMRTQDSVIAQDIYYQLTQEKFKVFFSRITLENQLGIKYEPYIFSALNSAKVMLVIGTKPEYFCATWVKNEWTRYLRIIHKDKNKLIIPCYRDMNPYNLPEELSRYQSQDMSKIGFMQDIIRGIKKVMSAYDSEGNTIVIDSSKANSAEPLVIRALQFLEFNEWDKAEEYIERALDIDPENGKIYLAKLMLDLKVGMKQDLINQQEPLENNKYFNMAIRYADANLAKELKDYNEQIKRRITEICNRQIYNEAQNLLNSNERENINKAKELFESLNGWEDATLKVTLCISALSAIAIKEEFNQKKPLYDKAINSLFNALTIPDFEKVKEQFTNLGDFEDSITKIAECDQNINRLNREKIERKYNDAVDLFNSSDIEKIKKAQEIFNDLNDYKDSHHYIQECPVKITILKNELIYAQGVRLMQEKKEQPLNRALEIFLNLGDYKDSQKNVDLCKEYLSIYGDKSYIATRKAKIIRTAFTVPFHVLLAVLDVIWIIISIIMFFTSGDKGICTIFLIFTSLALIFSVLKGIFCKFSFSSKWIDSENKIPIINKINTINNTFLQTLLRVVFQFVLTIIFYLLVTILFLTVMFIYVENCS